MFMIYLQNIKIKMSLRNNLLTSFKFKKEVNNGRRK